MSIVFTPSVVQSVTADESIHITHIIVGDGSFSKKLPVYERFIGETVVNASGSPQYVPFNFIVSDESEDAYNIYDIKLIRDEASVFATYTKQPTLTVNTVNNLKGQEWYDVTRNIQINRALFGLMPPFPDDINETDEAITALLYRKYALAFKLDGVKASFRFTAQLPVSLRAQLNTSSQRLLPMSASQAEFAIEATTARTGSMPVDIGALWSTKNCPEEALPWLAWAMSVDNWNVAWTAETKRKVISTSATVHGKKGTIGAVRRVLDSLGIPITIKEWFETGATPHTFELTAIASPDDSQGSESPLTEKLYTTLYQVVDDTKPTRSHYTFNIIINPCDTIMTAMYLQSVKHVYRESFAKHTPRPAALVMQQTAISQQVTYVYHNMEFVNE